MTSIELLPPERFYPTHWFPLLTPPTRTAALCYGIHTWDRTWVSSARGPDPLFEAEVIEVVTSTDDHKRQEKQRSQQTHRRHFHRTRRSRSGAEGEAASTVSTSDGTSYRTGADASDSGNGSPCDTDNTVSSSQGSSGASEGYSPIPLHACSHDPGTDGDTTTERILYPSAIIQVVDSSVSSEQNRGPTEIRPNGTLVFEDKAVFLGYAAAYRTIGVAQALDGSSGGYDAFKSSTPAAAPVAPALHSGHHVMGLTSSGTPPRPARLAPLATSHEDCPVCRSAGVVSGSVAQRSPPTPKIDSNSDSEAEASDSELEASSPSPVRIPPIVPDDPPEHERGVVHEDSAPAQLESAVGILCSSVSPTDPAYAVDAVHDDDSVQNGAVALDDTLTIGSVITEDDGGELTSTVSPIRLPDVDVALPGDNREQGDGGLHWHECVAIPEAVSLAVASAVLQPTTVASSSDVELALLSSVESVASVGVAIPPNVAVSLEADPVRVPISVASKPHPVRSRRAATIAAHQSALLERVDALTERMMHRLSTNLRGLDRISASFSRLPQDL